MDKLIKIKENKPGKDIYIPDFSIIYNKASGSERNKLSYEIITVLKENYNMIIEIHTEFLSLDYDRRTKVFMEFFEEIKKTGLNYRYKKLPAAQLNLNNIFKVLLQKRVENHQVYFFVDDQSWTNDSFIKKIPSFGIKYYFFDNNNDQVKVLDDLNCGFIHEETFNEFFKLIVFDCCIIGQMGLFTKRTTIEEIKRKLDL